MLEYFTQEALGFCLGIIVLFGYIHWQDRKDCKQRLKDAKADQNIEWQGEDICLKKKNYPTLDEDHRSGVKYED